MSVVNKNRLEKYDKIRTKYKDYEIVEINGEIIKNDRNLRELFHNVLKLPKYSGSSMDSVHDCFYDENWTKKRKFLILIKNIKNLEYHEGLIRIFKDISDYSKKRKNSFIFKVFIFNDNEK